MKSRSRDVFGTFRHEIIWTGLGLGLVSNTLNFSVSSWSFLLTYHFSDYYFVCAMWSARWAFAFLVNWLCKTEYSLCCYCMFCLLCWNKYIL